MQQLLASRGLTPNRHRGQNFLIDRNSVNRLLSLADLTPADVVLDLGAGLGTMTAALAPRVAEVVAVELDRDLLALARDTLSHLDNVRWVQGDLRELAMAELLDPEPNGPTKIVSNLPYNLSKLLLRRLLAEVERFECLVLTVQREVAERLLAPPGGKAYGPLSVACRLNAAATLEAIVPATCFYPRPRVESAVVRLTPPATPPAPPGERDQVMELVRTAFSQRRKTLVNALGAKQTLAPAERLTAALAELGRPPTVRAESLAPEDFVRLHRLLNS